MKTYTPKHFIFTRLLIIHINFFYYFIKKSAFFWVVLQKIHVFALKIPPEAKALRSIVQKGINKGW